MNFPHLGAVQVAGFTVEQAGERINASYKDAGDFPDPTFGVRPDE